MSEKEYALSKIHIDRCESCMSVFLDSGEHDAINRYLTSLDSPDVAAAEEEAFENDYRKKLVEMAMKFKTEILDRQDYT
jgi:Zn-finger nucleic acid-binding protein